MSRTPPPPSPLPTRLNALLTKPPGPAADAPALLEGGRPITRAALAQQVAQTVAWLLAHGIGPGDRVAVWLVNRSEWLALLLALARLGAVLVAANTRYKADELAYLLQRSGARLLVLQPGFRGIDFASVLAGIEPQHLPALRAVAVLGDGPGGAGTTAPLPGWPSPPFNPEAYPPSPHDAGQADAVTLLYTTSGTTRGPKLVMHTQRTLAGHAAQVARAHGLDAPGARLLAALPLCGTFGLTSTLAALLAGALVVLMDSFDAAAATRLLVQHAITHLYASDEMLRRICDTDGGTTALAGTRCLGFAAFQPGAADFAQAAAAQGLPLRGLYGSSEVQALFAIQPPGAGLAQRLAGGGLPADATAQVRVRRPDTGALAAPGEAGVLEIRAPGNFVGYLDDPEATAAVVDADGFFSTGDLGLLRDDGCFDYLTRGGDAIRLGGFLVNPAEIEDSLCQLPGVAQAGVVAVTIDGQTRAVAFVVAAPDTSAAPYPGAAPGAAAAPAPDEAALLAAARQRMAGYKLPARVWWVPALPVTPGPNGTKVQRAQLRDWARQRLGG